MTVIADVFPEIPDPKKMVRLKGVFQGTFRKTTWEMGRNFVGISIVACLKHLLITLKVVALEKVSSSNRKIPKTVC